MEIFTSVIRSFLASETVSWVLLTKVIAFSAENIIFSTAHQNSVNRTKKVVRATARCVLRIHFTIQPAIVDLYLFT